MPVKSKDLLGMLYLQLHRAQVSVPGRAVSGTTEHTHALVKKLSIALTGRQEETKNWNIM